MILIKLFLTLPLWACTDFSGDYRWEKDLNWTNLRVTHVSCDRITFDSERAYNLKDQRTFITDEKFRLLSRDIHLEVHEMSLWEGPDLTYLQKHYYRQQNKYYFQAGKFTVDENKNLVDEQRFYDDKGQFLFRNWVVYKPLTN